MKRILKNHQETWVIKKNIYYNILYESIGFFMQSGASFIVWIKNISIPVLIVCIKYFLYTFFLLSEIHDEHA